jgi:hypothetical protein
VCQHRERRCCGVTSDGVCGAVDVYRHRGHEFGIIDVSWLCWTETREVRGPNSTGFWTVAVPVMSVNARLAIVAGCVSPVVCVVCVAGGVASGMCVS